MHLWKSLLSLYRNSQYFIFFLWSLNCTWLCTETPAPFRLLYLVQNIDVLGVWISPSGFHRPRLPDSYARSTRSEKTILTVWIPPWNWKVMVLLMLNSWKMIGFFSYTVGSILSCYTISLSAVVVDYSLGSVRLRRWCCFSYVCKILVYFFSSGLQRDVMVTNSSFTPYQLSLSMRPWRQNALAWRQLLRPTWTATLPQLAVLSCL